MPFLIPKVERMQLVSSTGRRAGRSKWECANCGSVGVDKAGGTREQQGDRHPQGPVSTRGRGRRGRAVTRLSARVQVGSTSQGPTVQAAPPPRAADVSGTVRAARHTYTEVDTCTIRPQGTLGSERIPQPKYLCPHR